MKQKIMEEIMQQMLPYLDNAQLQKFWINFQRNIRSRNEICAYGYA